MKSETFHAVQQILAQCDMTLESLTKLHFMTFVRSELSESK